MHTHVTVFSTRGIGRASRVSSDGVERTEMAAHTPNLVLEDLVIKPGFEFTLARRCRGDFHGGLATAEDNVVLFRGEGGRVERGVGGEGLEDGEVAA